MIRYEFREERSSLGNVLRPVADVSMIPFRFGKALGFKQEIEGHPQCN
jgi:hypothetical protein